MNGEVVVDSSICASWVIRDEETQLSRRLLTSVSVEQVRLVVPALWWYELLNVIRMAVARRRLPERDVSRAIRVLANIPKSVIPAEAQSQEGIVAMALDTGLTAYDSAYLDLAQARRIPLVSADEDLLRLRPRFPWILSLEGFVAQLDKA